MSGSLLGSARARPPACPRAQCSLTPGAGSGVWTCPKPHVRLGLAVPRVAYGSIGSVATPHAVCSRTALGGLDALRVQMEREGTATAFSAAAQTLRGAPAQVLSPRLRLVWAGSCAWLCNGDMALAWGLSSRY